MKRHLGERLSALIDGELSDTQRERVLAHLAGCEDCRREAAALGQQQAEISSQIDQLMKSLLDDAIASGKAEVK